MAVIQDTPTRFTCVDPMGTRYEAKETESAGVIARTDEAGYFTTGRCDVAAELRERYPQMLITEHEVVTGGASLRAVTVTMPLLPYLNKYELIRRLKGLVKLSKHDAEAVHGEADDLLIRYINDTEITAVWNELARFYA